MVRRYVIPTVLAVALAGAVGGAQPTATQETPPPQPAQQPAQPPAQQPAAEQAATRTVEGCVYRAADIPARAPDVAERADIAADYILVASAGTGPAGTTGAVGTAGAATAQNMFKLEHDDDAKLRAMVGKRVRVTGKVEAERTAPAAPAPAAPAQPERELPELEVTTIAEATGECPAKPDVRR
jgi:hypothetical protein